MGGTNTVFGVVDARELLFRKAPLKPEHTMM